MLEWRKALVLESMNCSNSEDNVEPPVSFSLEISVMEKSIKQKEMPDSILIFF